MTERGRAEAIYLASAAGAKMQSVPSAQARAGLGIEGDRYANGTGHWSPIRRAGDHLTLIESEELERIAAATRLDIQPGATRRNVTTRGIRLDGLLGRRFRMGPVECLGVRRCEPCTYLDGLLGLEALPALVHRAGIRVAILTSGRLSVGDAIEPLDR